ncbi:MAG: hypothetical protein CMB42_02600 [Euryarchaeota archaeon]|nr:hypothetical protein [Euryarchaeota archaeon]|tara:strand:+ start:35 stop:370 length:336 start_codon:yes stop_codon:yes gene_type:complete
MSTVIYDDFCESCSAWAKFIDKRRVREINTVGQETQEGKKILQNRPSEFIGVDSVFLIDETGQWFSKSSAALRIVTRLRFPWPLLSTGLIVPRFIRDFVYDEYAKRRFRNF